MAKLRAEAIRFGSCATISVESQSRGDLQMAIRHAEPVSDIQGHRLCGRRPVDCIPQKDEDGFAGRSVVHYRSSASTAARCRPAGSAIFALATAGKVGHFTEKNARTRPVNSFRFFRFSIVTTAFRSRNGVRVWAAKNKHACSQLATQVSMGADLACCIATSNCRAIAQRCFLRTVLVRIESGVS